MAVHRRNQAESYGLWKENRECWAGTTATCHSMSPCTCTLQLRGSTVSLPRSSAGTAARNRRNKGQGEPHLAAWQMRMVIGLGLVCTAAAVCGDGIPEVPQEECDDNNVVDQDGCSGTCKRERIAYMTWYNSSDCSGKIWKQEIFNDREYVRSKNANPDYRCNRFCTILRVSTWLAG